jgi:spermidine synthase
VNGRHHSVLPFGGIHTLLGAAPAAMHPAPERAAVIGLGSGDTAWAAGCRRPETRAVTVFEICAPQLGLLRRVAAEPDPPAKLGRFLEDPRVTIRFADGRNALLRSDERYDLIEMDALPPSSPYSGNLYSVEFYELCARRLRPGGLMCTWAPSARVHGSFTTAFAHVVELDAGRVLVGSNDPIPFDPAAWQARATMPQMVAYLGPARVQELVGFLRGALPAVHRPLGARDVNRDLFPRDELNSP